ncbi:acetyl-CoA C-acyltransferase, partial [Klebsiella pneumoniae]|nr:acetyl-CoA C-acyltransferase [Klebsiella pneumoniae]
LSMGMDITVAGGQDNISGLQQRYFEWVGRERDPNVIAHASEAYMPMLQTAEFVAKKYGISREAQDRYSLESQKRTAAAQQAGLFKDEIVPIQ